MKVLPIAMGVGLAVAVNLDLALPVHYLLPDEGRFLRSAGVLEDSGYFLSDGLRAGEMPGTAAFYAILGLPLLWLRLVQAFLLPLQAWLVYRICHRIEPRAAILAGCIWALWPEAVFYQSAALSEMLFVTVLLGAMAWRRE